MTYRCSACDHLSKSDSNPDCKTKLNCNFQRVETIHLLHPEGTGRLLARKQVAVANTEEKVRDVELFMCCESNNPSPIATAYRPAVTCIDCLANIPAPVTPDE